MKISRRKITDGLSFPRINQLPQSTDSPNPLSLDEFAKMREKLWSQKSESVREIDGMILTISSAFLGLSVTFLKDIVGPSIASKPEFLWSSWLAFALSIIFVFVSHHFSRYACEYELKRSEFYFVKRIGAVLGFKNHWQRLTQFSNSCAALCFITGILLSALFVKTNMEKKINDEKRQSRSAVSQVGNSRLSNRDNGRARGRIIN